MNVCTGFILFVGLFALESSQDCVWYGECNEENGKIQNCPAQEPGPFPFRNETKSVEILREWCPQLLKDHPDRKFCCDDSQLETMVQSMNFAAGIFARCPTCMENLNKHICLMTCSANQSKFLKATDIGTNGQGTKYIKEVHFYVSKEYIEGTFNSCKEVTVPSTGGKAIDISCGVWGANKQCTPERLFQFFGDYRENPVAPFYVRYLTSPPPEGYQTLHIQALPCNESYESSKACSCSDCEASCTIPFDYQVPPGPFLIGNADGVVVIMTLVFLALSGLITTFTLFHNNRKNKPELPTENSVTGNGSHLGKCGNAFTKRLENIFKKWGIFCARNPILILAVSSWIVAIFIYGITNLHITTDPIEIWASPDCQTRREKTYFDTRFTPFYRTNQIFIKSKGLQPFNWTSPSGISHQFGPAFHCNFLEEVYHLQARIQQLGVNEGFPLDKICLAPMKSQFFNDDSIDYCTIQSVWGYLKNDVSLCSRDRDALYDQLQRCLRNNYDPSCLAPYGGPIFSPLAVGGYHRPNASDDDFLLATGLSLTFIVNNPLEKTDLEMALNWEKLFVEFLKEWTRLSRPEFMEIAFSAERSIQDEIERESEAEMMTIIISYVVMFFYITVSLGSVRGFSSLLLETKFTLGLGGIAIVLGSVFASLGLFGYLGVSTTLLTIEVIPFLVLAVGVDNIFILVHNYQVSLPNSKGSIEETVGCALGKVGPSILLTTISEAACFLIGTLSDMPAIKTFAEYSSVAIVFNFFLQCTCFVSILALDSKRQEKNLADVLCCVRVKKKKTAVDENLGFMHFVFKNYYRPLIMKRWIRISVLLCFTFWFCASIACIPHIEKGLDKEVSMPEDSYIIDYFQFMSELLSVGPPVYFVIKDGINFTKREEINAVCGSVGCDSDSLVTYLSRASKLSNSSYLAKTPSSWIDDYFDWLLNSDQCCRQFRENGSFCPHQIESCDPCDLNMTDWRPSSQDFGKYLPFFLNDNPDTECSKAGHAAYAGGVNFELNTEGDLEVKDNYFMTYHTPLKTSRDFYTALENARNIASHLSKVLTEKLHRVVEVFPYSVFYVYYEQYLNIVQVSLVSLSLSLLAIFCATFLLTGFDLMSSVVVCVMVTSILVNMTGMLYWWNITLNAISLVNLIVSVGIGVEFCSHIMHAFRTSTEPDGMSKAEEAICSMGISVFSGITLTKFLGIVVLAFAQTLMLRTFYFKMYLGIIVVGVTHGLLFMPVLLSYLG